MKNKWLLVLVCFLMGKLSFAQRHELQVQGVSPNIYLTHIVQAKETWYSIGRVYNVSPKQMAPYNALSLDKALAIGQTIKVPLTAENFSQDGSKATDEVLVPLHHTIQEKEWLYRVSVNYNKVPVESLEKWNNINKDQAKAGLSIVVGYLKVKAAQSSLADQAATRVARTSPVTLNMPDEKKPDNKELKKPATPVPVIDNIDPTLIRGNTAKEESKPVVSNPVAINTNNSSPVVTGNAASGTKLSYFKASYEEGGKSISGNAGVFKSTSGWTDGKYYALVNSVAVGTIVKINDPVSGRTIFAKVLGNLPDMKESLGLVARISDAGAAELNAAGVKFSVELRY
ncbi:MAG: LysM peptidoglycan-binding domain-containing protein [Chitinophagaceae bacterium]